MWSNQDTRLLIHCTHYTWWVFGIHCLSLPCLVPIPPTNLLLATQIPTTHPSPIISTHCWCNCCHPARGALPDGVRYAVAPVAPCRPCLVVIIASASHAPPKAFYNKKQQLNQVDEAIYQEALQAREGKEVLNSKITKRAFEKYLKIFESSITLSK